MCGFIGIQGPAGAQVAPEIYEALLAIQHRGQDAAGITTFTDTFHCRKDFGLVRDVFDERHMEALRGNLGVGHVRYPTIGGGGAEDAQPFHTNFPIGVAMAHNGNLTNFGELKEKHFKSSGTRLNSSCDVEVILYVFVRALSERLEPGAKVTEEHIFAAVRAVYQEVRGAYSVVAALPDVGLVAFRDPFGIKPICVGKRDGGTGSWWACASESVALDINGYSHEFDLSAGEAMFVPEGGDPIRKVVGDKPHRPCVFEYVYFARPDSMIDDVSVYKTRIRFGEELAEQWKEAGAPMPDSVVPIPDSSRDSAMAMATALGVPYREGLVKNRYIGRTFIMPSQDSRQNSVRRKLNTIKLEFEGKDVLLVDDSIVRGNTSLRIVRMAREAGARKIYLASTSPPLVSPCPYGVDMATKTEFVAAGRSNDEVAKLLEVDHLMYLDRGRMNEAARRGNPGIESFCNACFTGEYPTGDITQEVLDEIGGERTAMQKSFAFTPTE